MSIRRRLVLQATTLAVAFLACSAPATLVGATVPPNPEPTPTSPPADPSQGNGDVGIVESWALAPAASSDPNQAGNRPELSYVSDAGSTIDDAVTVYNFGTVPLNFEVYATDAYNDDHGQFALLAGDKPPSDVGTWVTFPQKSLTVQPGQQATMPITIKIPADAAPGDHAGAILASSPTLGTGEQGQVVTLDRRTGTRLYVRVNGDLVPDLAVDNVATEYHQAVNSFGGSADVTFRITNRGNVRLSGTPTVAIAGPFGLLEKKVKLDDIVELLPGEDVVMTTPVADVPASMFDFTTVRVEPHGSGDVGAGKNSTGKDQTFAPPITVLVVLLLAVVVVLLLRKRRRSTARASTELGVAPQPVLDREHQPT